MTGTSARSRQSRGRGVSLVLDIVLLIVAVGLRRGRITTLGIGQSTDGRWYIDKVTYVEFACESARWRDLGDEFPSPGQVQFSSTDAAAQSLIPELSPFFLVQGYAESTSARQSADYLSQGLGAKPRVFTTHTVVGLTAHGAEIGCLLTEAPDLQELAALGIAESTPENVPGNGPPDYDTLEWLIKGVSASYSPLTAPGPFAEEEQ